MRDALNVQYDARYGNMGGICMHARPDREGRLACGEPSFTPTEHNHTCGELDDNRLTIPSLLALTLFTDTYAYVTQ